MTIDLLLYSGNKNLEKIQQIVTSMEAANFAKSIISQTSDLVMMSKKRQLGEKQGPQAKINKK